MRPYQEQSGALCRFVSSLQRITPSCARPFACCFATRGEAEREPAPALTAREDSVIACLARGLSNAEIAAELGISTATVRSHVSHLMAKLGATNRTQAVFNAAALGIGS